MAQQDQRGQQAQPDLRGQQVAMAQQAPQVLAARRDPMDHLGLRVQQVEPAHQGLRDQPDPMAHPDLPDQLEELGQQALPDQPDPQGLRVLMGTLVVRASSTTSTPAPQIATQVQGKLGSTMRPRTRQLQSILMIAILTVVIFSPSCEP